MRACALTHDTLADPLYFFSANELKNLEFDCPNNVGRLFVPVNTTCALAPPGVRSDVSAHARR